MSVHHAALSLVRDAAPRPAPAALRGTCDNHTQYVAGCEPCQERSRTRRRTRYRQVAYGQLQPGWVDATQAAAHINDLHDNHNMSYRHIAVAAGVRRDAVLHMAGGTQRQAAASTIDALLRVAPSDSVDEVLVRRVLNGHAPFSDLGDADLVAFWPKWRRRRKAGGLEHGPDGFAKQYGISRNAARRIAYAATRAASTKHRTPAAAQSRTNRKVA